MIKYIFLILLSGLMIPRHENEPIPIYFSEYDIEIYDIGNPGDTILFEKSSTEKFKFQFESNMGKCYCERYIKNKLIEKGFYENSLDTLKRYTSARYAHGRQSPISVKVFFEPLKNGKWYINEKGRKKNQVYVLGVLQSEW